MMSSCEYILNFTDCKLSDSEEEIIPQLYFVFGVLCTIIAMIGIIMNTITIYILRSKNNMKVLFNYLLSGLLICCNVFLLTRILIFFMFDFGFKWLQLMFPYLIYPMQKMSYTASIFMMVSMAHQRWTVILDPIKHKRISADEGSRRKRAMFYIVSAIGFAFLFNIPRLLYFKYNETTEKHEKTDFRFNYHFKVLYENLFCNVINAFAPITLLTFFNYNVYNHIKIQKEELRTVISEMQVEHPSFKLQKNVQVEQIELDSGTTVIKKRRKKERKEAERNKSHTNILLISVILFVVCHSFNCIKEFYGDLCEPFSLKVVQALSRLLLILHSSINPFIYIWKNVGFRQHLFDFFKDIICCKWKKRCSKQQHKETAISSSAPHSSKGGQNRVSLLPEPSKAGDRNGN